MNIYLNDSLISVNENSLLADVLKQHANAQTHFAVAINHVFVPKHSYETRLNENDRIDIIIPMQGG